MLETYLRMEALEHFAVSDLCIQGFTVAGTFDQESPKQASEVGNSSWDSWEKETHQNWALWLQVGEGICSFSGSIWIHREVCLFNGFQRFFFLCFEHRLGMFWITSMSSQEQAWDLFG